MAREQEQGVSASQTGLAGLCPEPASSLGHSAAIPNAVQALIMHALTFADWAAGEGITPGERDQANGVLPPDEFLLAYSDETGDEDWDTLPQRVAALLGRP
jgi:hypothetical protein